MRYLIAVCLAIFATFSQAASLTDTQKTTLKTVALADPVASQYVTSPSAENDELLAQWFNAASSFVAWKTSIPVRDIYERTSGTGTTWDWTTYIANTTAAERDAWAAMTGNGTLSPALQQVRDAWAKIYSGTGAAVVAQRAHLTAISQRNATRAEAALATGTGTAASPGTLIFEGTISQGDASTIRSLP